MKKIILLLISLSVFADIKVTTLETKTINYENGEIGGPPFRIICINGYQWLQCGVGSSRSISQMSTEINNQIRLIKCQNK